MLDIDESEFISNLLLTQAYCEQQMQTGEISPLVTLRTINPIHGEGKVFNYRLNDYPTLSGKTPKLIAEWAPSADPYDNAFFLELWEKQLAHKKAGVLAYESQYQGKILVVEYDCDIPDGAAAVESEGFVDAVDFPPIDTWFYRARNSDSGWVLFCWVPQHFISFADEAIAVHFLDIIHWFEDWAPVECGSVVGLKNHKTPLSPSLLQRGGQNHRLYLASRLIGLPRVRECRRE